MSDDPNYTPFGKDPKRRGACPAGEDEMPGGTGWVCTDHYNWFGETLHVAAHPGGAVAAWLDKKRYWDSNEGKRHERIMGSFGELETYLLRLPQFAPEKVSKKEIDKAAASLLKMVEEMSDRG